MLLAAGLTLLPSRAVAAPSIVKPLPPSDFVVHDTNAETRWEALGGSGSLTPASKFFVRNHTSTPLLDTSSWRLRIHGSGVTRPVSLGRLLGPAYPPEGRLVTTQVAKSAFELAWSASVPAGRQVLTGRSWSPDGVWRVEVSTDGRTWRRATPVSRGGWARWQVPWHAAPGEHVLRARVDGQPDEWPHDTQGYLFGAVVRHPVTIV